MTRDRLILAAAGGSALLLAGAWTFQAMGYPPCELCWWQRYPHMVAIAAGVLAYLVRGALFPWVGALAALTTSGLGLYHTGVERHWWAGPSACTGTGALDTSDLLSTDGPHLVMCDQVSWALGGISMPSWNMIFSAILVVLWVMAALRSRSLVTRAA